MLQFSLKLQFFPPEILNTALRKLAVRSQLCVVWFLRGYTRIFCKKTLIKSDRRPSHVTLIDVQLEIKTFFCKFSILWYCQQ